MADIVIQNWSVRELQPDIYTPPELRRKVLSGKVYGHPQFEDGEEIATSCLVSSGWDNGVFVVETRNNKYILGTISPEYLGWMKENDIPYNHDYPVKVHDPTKD